MRLNLSKIIKRVHFSAPREYPTPQPTLLDLECLKFPLPECVSIDSKSCPIAEKHPLSQTRFRPCRK